MSAVGAAGTVPVTPDPGARVPFLEARDVRVHFGGVRALDGLSLTAWTTGIVGLLGPNGSGKSTLLGVISRLVPMTSGELVIGGASASSVPPEHIPRLGIARTFQTVRLIDELTVAENVQLGLDLFGAPRAGWRRRRAVKPPPTDAVANALSLVNLDGLARVRPGELSYGFQRRVEIARALVMQPRLLLLDEPTAGMSRRERGEISDLLLQLRGEGIAIMLVEHDVQMMVDTCDYLYAMSFGRLLTEGEPEQVVQDAAVQEAYLGNQWKK